MIRIATLLVIGMVTSCASTDAPTQGALHADSAVEGLARAAVVTTGTPRLDRNKPSSISWLVPLDVSGRHPVLASEQLREQVTTVVNHKIQERGYAVLPLEGDFQLVGVLVFAGSRDQQTVLRESGGIDPGLAGFDELPGKGSLVLELRQGRLVRWKGSVQIYLAPHFDQHVALRRIEYAIAQLLATWP